MAAALKVPVDKLTRWLAGDDLTPTEVYLFALDLVATGPLVRVY